MPNPLQSEHFAANVPPQSPLRVLSLHLSDLGIATYSRQMQAYFAESPTCSVDSIWWDDDRKWQYRVVRRLLVLDDAIFGRRSKRTWLRRQNLDFHRLRGDLGPSIEARRLLKRHLGSNAYNILHIHPQSLGHVSIDLMRRIPTVLHTDMTAAQLSEERTSPRMRWTFAPNAALDRRAFHAARKVVAWSEWAARSVRDDCGIESDKVCVVHPGVDLTQFAVRGVDEFHDGQPVRLLFAGYDFERKGGRDVLDVFIQRFANQAELHLMTTAAIRSDHPRVHIHRDIAAFSPEWHELYIRSDIFAMPTYRDSFGMVYIEAMAAGLPVIGSRLSAIPEIISEGENGFMVTPGRRDELAEAIAALIANPTRRREMGRRGRNIVEKRFDAHVNFAQLESVFQQVAL